MSERDGYEHGVPCWIAGAHPDPERAAGISSFGWEAAGDPIRLKLRGRDVAGMGHGEDGACRTAVVADPADPDATAAKAAELGGSVLMGPMGTPMGRRAVLADPQGATFSISRVVPA